MGTINHAILCCHESLDSNFTPFDYEISHEVKDIEKNGYKICSYPPVLDILIKDDNPVHGLYPNLNKMIYDLVRVNIKAGMKELDIANRIVMLSNNFIFVTIIDDRFSIISDSIIDNMITDVFNKYTDKMANCLKLKYYDYKTYNLIDKFEQHILKCMGTLNDTASISITFNNEAMTLLNMDSSISMDIILCDKNIIYGESIDEHIEFISILYNMGLYGANVLLKIDKEKGDSGKFISIYYGFNINDDIINVPYTDIHREFIKYSKNKEDVVFGDLNGELWCIEDLVD